MSAFTERLYSTWLRSNGCAQRRRPGFGAAPQAGRREGYPNGQTSSQDTCHQPRTTWRFPASAAGSREGLPRANDAASCPEKPAVLTPDTPVFLPCPEKSSIKSTP
jgi:hypothetical protein